MQVPAYLHETTFQNREQEPTTYTFRSPCRIEPLVTSTDDRQQAGQLETFDNRSRVPESCRSRAQCFPGCEGSARSLSSKTGNATSRAGLKEKRQRPANYYEREPSASH